MSVVTEAQGLETLQDYLEFYKWDWSKALQEYGQALRNRMGYRLATREDLQHAGKELTLVYIARVDQPEMGLTESRRRVISLANPPLTSDGTSDPVVNYTAVTHAGAAQMGHATCSMSEFLRPYDRKIENPMEALTHFETWVPN